jgi:putative ABC transport system ATP-binding protein
MSDALIRAEAVTRVYRTGEVVVDALREIDLVVERGEFTAIAGPSGSGKSTLLNLIGGLDNPTSGRVFLAGHLIGDMSGNELSDFRRDHIGFVFQSYNLIPVLDVVENIEYVMLLQGVSSTERRRRVEEMLAEVGLEGMADRRPDQLSGGQQQRVAIARAMVSRPDLILADEPTANLDSTTGGELLDMMRRLNETRGMTFVFSTHDRMIMERSRRLLTLADGRIDSDEVRG